MKKTQARGGKAKSGAVGILVKLVLLALMIYAGITLYNQQGAIQTAEAQQAQLSARVQELADKNAALRADIAAADDPDKLEEIARNKLGMVKSGEKVFYDTGY